jgi:hypothetical protein
MFLDANLISWSSKHQNVISRSSAEAECQTVAEVYWLRQLLQEFQAPLMKSTLVYYNNVGAVYLSTSPIRHQCMKHVDIDLHFVRERVACPCLARHPCSRIF